MKMASSYDFVPSLVIADLSVYPKKSASLTTRTWDNDTHHDATPDRKSPFLVSAMITTSSEIDHGLSESRSQVNGVSHHEQ